MPSEKATVGTPFCDSGSLIKFYLNPFYGFRINNRKIHDDVPVTVVGSGKYNGDHANEFVNQSGEKLIYLTYRNCFPKLPNGSTTDSYWGCLVRTGQMVMAQAFMRFYSGGASVIPEDRSEELRNRVKPLFMDTPNAPLSLHRVEFEAHEEGIKYARWLSPTQACKAVYAACLKYRQAGYPCPYVICNEDRNINKAEAYKALRGGEAVLFLIPVVMGIKKLNEKYQQVLLRCLDMEHVCGIAGGSGKASIYLFGHQGGSVFFLDPHYVQPAYTSPQTEGKMSCKRGTMTVAKVDPCMFIGFYVPNEAEFEKFLVELKEMNSFVAFPLISISEDDPRKKVAQRLGVQVDQVNGAQADRIIAVGSPTTDPENALFSPAEEADAAANMYPTDAPVAPPVPAPHSGNCGSEEAAVNPLAALPDSSAAAPLTGEADTPPSSDPLLPNAVSTYPVEKSATTPIND